MPERRADTADLQPEEAPVADTGRVRAALPAPRALLAVPVLALATGGLVLAGGVVPRASSEPVPEVATVDLSFTYTADGGDGFVDQVLAIANTGGAAGAPTFDVIPLDAAGDQVRGIRVETAFGSDRGAQVVPAHTEVIDVLRFVGVDAAEVVDVRVEKVEGGLVPGDVPPANDLRVRRYDVSGGTDDERTLGRVELTNTYDRWVRVQLVGLQFAPAPGDGTQQFTRVTELGGPIDIAPGRTARQQVAVADQGRFYGSVRAYLVR